MALVLAACVAPAAPAAGTTASSGTTSNAASTTGDKPVTIRWWHIWADPDPARANWQNLADEYMKDHPNVKIEITIIPNDPYKEKLATNMQAGDPPDLFQTWGGGVLWQYADAGLVQDLTDALKEDSWGDTFLPGPMVVYQHDGKTWGVPWRFGMVGIYYNKDLFQKAGIASTPTTWTEFLADVQKLQAAGITPIALGEKDKWPGHFWWTYLALRYAGQKGFNDAYTRSGHFNDEAFVNAGEQLQKLIDLKPFQDGFLQATYNDEQTVMGTEKAAMELQGQWGFGADQTSAGDNKDNWTAHADWFPFPMVDGGAGQATDALGGGDGFAIGKNAPPETIDFVKWLTSKDHQASMAAAGIASLPVVKGVESSVQEPIMHTLLQHFGQATYLQLYLDQFLPPAVGLAVNDEVQELFAGTKNAQQVADDIEKVAAQEMQ